MEARKNVVRKNSKKRSQNNTNKIDILYPTHVTIWQRTQLIVFLLNYTKMCSIARRKDDNSFFLHIHILRACVCSQCLFAENRQSRFQEKNSDSLPPPRIVFFLTIFTCKCTHLFVSVTNASVATL